MMTDSEHAAKIRELASELNNAIGEAHEAGLEVDVELRDMRTVAQPTRQFIVAKLKRAIQ